MRFRAGGIRVAVAVLGAAAITSLAPAGAEAGRLAKLERALDRLVALDQGPPGAAVLVRRPGKVRFVTAGVANLASGGPYRRNHKIRIASTSKAFSGAVALALVDRGKLALRSTIGELLPDLPAAWHPITLRQLLQHTSGLPSYSNDPDYLAYLINDPAASIAPRDLLEFVADEPLRFAPGTAYEYSNSDNIVIGLLAEAATGQTYDRLLRRLVFRPLGLRQTSLPDAVPMPTPYVRGYDVDPPDPPEDVSAVVNPQQLWAAGALVSTPANLTRFIRAYASGELISRKVRRQQRRFLPGAAGEPPGPGRNAGGLALYRYRLGCGTVLGHTGNFLGYTTLIVASRNGRRSAVVSVNTQISADVKPEVFSHLHRIFRLAACTALRG